MKGPGCNAYGWGYDSENALCYCCDVEDECEEKSKIDDEGDDE